MSTSIATFAQQTSCLVVHLIEYASHTVTSVLRFERLNSLLQPVSCPATPYRISRHPYLFHRCYPFPDPKHILSRPLLRHAYRVGRCSLSFVLNPCKSRPSKSSPESDPASAALSASRGLAPPLSPHSPREHASDVTEKADWSHPAQQYSSAELGYACSHSRIRPSLTEE